MYLTGGQKCDNRQNLGGLPLKIFSKIYVSGLGESAGGGAWEARLCASVRRTYGLRVFS